MFYGYIIEALKIGETQGLWTYEIHKKDLMSRKTGSMIPGVFHILHHKHSVRPDSVNWKTAHLLSHCHFDDQGYGPWSSIREPAKKTKIVAPDEWVRKILPAYRSGSKYTQHRIGSSTHSGILVLLQKIDDRTQRAAWVPMFEMLERLVEITPKHIPILVKRHPLCRSPRVSAALSEAWIRAESIGKTLVVTKSDIKQLMPISSTVITVNSGAGFEALLFGKKVIVTGQADYEHACLECHHVDQLEDLLFVASPRPAQIINNFLYYYLEVGTVRCDESAPFAFKDCMLNRIETGLCRPEETPQRRPKWHYNSDWEPVRWDGKGSKRRRKRRR